MRVSDAQVRKLMESYEKHGEVGKASVAPVVEPLQVDLAEYDALLRFPEAVAS